MEDGRNWAVIIDAHVHVGPWLHADFLGRTNDLGYTLDVLSESGVGGAVLMPSDTCDNESLCEAIKRTVAQGTFSGPMWLFAWVRPIAAGSPGSSDLAWIRAHAHEVSGLKLHPSLARVRVNDESYRPFLELAEELSLVVLVHCGRWAEVAGYAHAIDLAFRFPEVRFILAHAGGDTPPNSFGAAQAVKERGLTNVWFEISGLREYWVIERNIALLGAGRYLLGSDFPLAHPRMYIAAVGGMAITEAERQQILGDNALRLLGAPFSTWENRCMTV